MTYLNVDEVDTAVVNLAAAYPSLTQLITLPHQTIQGRTVHALRIGGGSAGSRDVVMAIGGQHAREWGTCEILINFMADILEAYQLNAGLAYSGKSFTSTQIKEIVDGLHLVVLPLVNPDGRKFDQEHQGPDDPANPEPGGWRRNRNTAYGDGSPTCIGVDLNRNYDFLFDFKSKFHPDVWTPGSSYPYPIVVSDDPCSIVYHGPTPFSEPETKNVRWLLDMFPRTRWFFDIHSYTEKILYPWGDDDNQGNDPGMNFRQTSFDGTRGLKSDSAYREYIPGGDEAVHHSLGERMRDAIAAVRGRVYTVTPSFSGLYPTCGTADEYAYSRHLADPSKPKTISFTPEWGRLSYEDEDINPFHPPWPEMEQIIDEMTAGLIEFCVAAPCGGGLIAVSLDTPNLKFIDVPPGEEAVRAIVFTVQSCSAVQFTADPPVKTSSGPGSFGLPLGGVESLAPASSAAPRQVRIWVSFQAPSPNASVTGTVTVHCPVIGQDFVVPITANTSPPIRIASVLALDRSASMQWASGIPGKARIDVLHDAAPIYANLLPDDHAIGLVAFDHDPHPVAPVVQADMGGRGAALTGIANHQPNPAGNTAIGDGVELAHDTLQPLTGFAQKAIVVFTDGHETAGKYIHEVEALLNERVFALGLGTASELNPVALNKLVSNSDGYLMLTGDLTGDDEIRVEKYFAQILAGVSNAEIVVDPEGWLLPGEEHRIPFTITHADRVGTAFILSATPWAIDFVLETPEGMRISPIEAAGLPAIDFVVGERVHQFRMTFPVPVGSGAGRGLWHAVLTLSPENFKRCLAEGRTTYQGAASHGVRYGFNVHAFSSTRLAVSVDQKSFEPGATVGLRASFTQSGLPVIADPSVVAELTRPDGKMSTLVLMETEPGDFEGSFIASSAGIYPLRFRAHGRDTRGDEFWREQLRTAFVWRGGDDGRPPAVGGEPQMDWDALIECLLGEKRLWGRLEEHGIDVEVLRRCWKRRGELRPT